MKKNWKMKSFLNTGRGGPLEIGFISVSGFPSIYLKEGTNVDKIKLLLVCFVQLRYMDLTSKFNHEAFPQNILTAS